MKFCCQPSHFNCASICDHHVALPNAYNDEQKILQLHSTHIFEMNIDVTITALTLQHHH
jgi:hypothetical protein